MNSSNIINPFELRKKVPRVMFTNPELGRRVEDVFDCNEYDPSIEKNIRSCDYCYKKVWIYGISTIKEIRKYRTEWLFAQELDQLNTHLPIDVPEGLVVELTCPNVLASFEAMLFATKSLLDVLCRYLLSSKFSIPINGFNKDKDIVGGRVLNTLIRNTPKSKVSISNKLIKLIEKHKALWIDHLVFTRDEMVHAGKTVSCIGFWVYIESGRTAPLRAKDVRNPLSHDLEELEELCQRLLTSIEEFTLEFRDLLYPPNERKEWLKRLALSRAKK